MENMEQENNDLIKCLSGLGYPEISERDISGELQTLFKDIGFESIKQRVNEAKDAGDTDGFIRSLKDLMFRLEGKGIYRPDAPVRLIRLLVNGLNLKNEDIFFIISRASMPLEEKLKEQEFLASCAAITQLGHIMLNCLVPKVNAASSGEHVFLVIESLSADSRIFVDFSIDSIKEIDPGFYDRKGNHWQLKKDRDFSKLDAETAQYLTQYYSFFHLTSGIGLNHNIHNNLGLAYDKMGYFEKALDEFREALRLNKDYNEVHNNIAITYHKMGQQEEAEKELLEAIRLKPGYSEARCNLGAIYTSSGRLDEAMEQIREALLIDPDHAPAHNRMGEIHALQEHDEEAIAEFREAVRIDENYTAARNNLGNLYFGSGMYNDALNEFMKAADTEPFLSEAHYGIGLAHYELKNYEKALHAFIKAVYYSPELLEDVPENLMLRVRQGVSRLK